jgi:AcrR family transcriptional regulator
MKHVSLPVVKGRAPRKDRRDKILDAAVSLAEEGGFDNVRQRDVAAQAGVALGTLYKRFRSKEDLLCAALERDSEFMERRMEDAPAEGKDPVERCAFLFNLLTRGLLRKPKYARALIRAMASGEPETAGKIAAYQDRVTGLIIAAVRGVGRLGYTETNAKPITEKEKAFAQMVQNFWFASLVGWSAGLINQNDVIAQVKNAASILARGMSIED